MKLPTRSEIDAARRYAQHMSGQHMSGQHREAASARELAHTKRSQLIMALGGWHGFELLSVYASADLKKIYIFLVAGGKGIALEDDNELFPSEKLLAKLNLLRE